METTYFRFEEVLPGSPAYERYLEVRHDVFCTELGRVQPTGLSSSNGRPIETDGYDVHSRHFVAYYKPDESVAGFVRVIMPNEKGLNVTPRYVIDHPLPYADATDDRIGEISRMAIAQHFRRRHSDQGKPIQGDPASEMAHGKDGLRRHQPELVLGSQMERHIAKRLRIPCAVISAPFHVQDHPARYSPQMGFEGANVLFDTWVHPLVMGLEEHLLHMFRDDFEFNDASGPSHLGGHGAAPATPDAIASTPVETAQSNIVWLADAEAELRKIPFFVRGKARKNTERFAAEHGLTSIALETLYDAKSHYSR